MAFATKYTANYSDLDGNAWSVDFMEDGFGGSETELTAGETPVVIRHNVEDRWQTICGTSADIQLVYDSNIDDLFTTTSQTIKVEVKIGASNRFWGWWIKFF